MGLGVSLPWMLPWLAAAVVPLVLARLAVRRPRLVRWGPSDLLTEAARTSRLTRGGLPWLSMIVRGLLLAAAAAAAARPFWLPPDWFPSTPSAVGRRAIVTGDDGSLILILTDADPTAGDGAGIGSPAIQAAIESLASVDGTLGRAAIGAGHRVPPTVGSAAVSEVTRPAPGVRTLLILADPPPPSEADARRLTEAVAAGAGLLVCLGPRALGDEDRRRRLSTWLEELAGITIDGRVSLADSAIEVIDAWGSPAAPAARVGPTGFASLVGPGVTAAAVLGGGGSATILARTQPEGLPLVVEARSGRGTVCVAAVPMSLPETAADAWSDLAAWPAFLPFLDRLVSRLLVSAEATPPAGAARVGAAAVPLAPVLVAAAIACLLADWWMSARAAAGAAEPRGRLLPWLGRGGAAVILAAMALAWFRLPAADPRRAAGPRPAALLIDVSPSMAADDSTDVPRGNASNAASSRLAAVLAALTAPAGDASPLDGIARDRPLDVSSVAAHLTRLGRYPQDATASRVRSLAATAAAPRASRIGDAIVDLATAGDDETSGVSSAPAAILVASDGAITAGASWATAAHLAAQRGVPLIAIPVDADGPDRGDEALPPGFRITAVTAPRLCHADEPYTIDISAEATAAGGPLEARIAGDAAGPPLSRGRLDASPLASGMIQRFTGRLVVPAPTLAAGSLLESAVITVGRPGDPPVASADAIASFPLAITADPVRVLMIDSSPRFEYRFLERLLSRDRAFAVERCLLAPGPPGRSAPGSLPRSTAEWNRFDVVVLGDVAGGSAAADRASAWRSLREAAASDGIGIAWIPGTRWWSDPDAGLDWLPAVPGGIAAATTAHSLRATAGGRTGGWLVPGVLGPTAGRTVPEGFHPEVFAVLHPASLRPTARVIASVADADGSTPSRSAVAAAMIVDRLGSATILGHFCETWRWQRHDEQAYRSAWRRNLFTLAEPHQFGRLYAATIAVRPVAPETDDVVRIEIVPGRAGTECENLQLEITSPPPAAAADQKGDVRLLDLPKVGFAGAATVAIEGLAAGVHVVRLVPAADAPARFLPSPLLPVHRIVVNAPPVEMPNGPNATAALVAAARASGGTTVALDSIAALPATVAEIVQRNGSARTASAPGPTDGAWHGARYAAHLLMLSLVIATVAAWWQPRDPHAAGEPTR